MTLKEEIVAYINNSPGATDNELERALNRTHQTINQACRALEEQGALLRQVDPANGLIGNYPANTGIPQKRTAQPPIHTVAEDKPIDKPLQEESIKHILYERLVQDGWSVKAAWGHAPGIDIDARRNGDRWVIEVKGPGSRQPMRVNYFIGILGEILQRMDDPNARYSIALPDMAQYRGLWERLPSFAKERTTIDLLLVSPDGKIEILK